MKAMQHKEKCHLKTGQTYYYWANLFNSTQTNGLL